MSRYGTVLAAAVAASLATAGDWGRGLSHREREELERDRKRKEQPAPEPVAETRQMRRARERREAKLAARTPARSEERRAGE